MLLRNGETGMPPQPKAERDARPSREALLIGALRTDVERNKREAEHTKRVQKERFSNLEKAIGMMAAEMREEIRNAVLWEIRAAVTPLREELVELRAELNRCRSPRVLRRRPVPAPPEAD